MPDFADGFNRFNNEGSGASASFVPLVLAIPPSRLGDLIKFTYSASNPASIQREGDDVAGYRFIPAGGSLRIWTKDGGTSRNCAPVNSGGDYVAPGTEYESSTLGFGGPNEVTTVTLYLEGIAASQSLADQDITVHVGDDSDVVKVTVFGTKLVRVTGDSSVEDAKNQILPSHPSPIINVTACVLSNVRPSEDGSKILGTLSVGGFVTSSICDLTEGAQGQVTQVNIFINGNTSPDLTFGTAVFKSTAPGFLLQPFPFVGFFAGTIENVELDSGNNTVTVTAADNVPRFGISGYSHHSILVDATPPEQTVTDAAVSIQLNSAVPEIPRVMSLALVSGDQNISCQLLETETGSNDYVNEEEGVTVHFTTVFPQATVEWGDGVYLLDFDLTAIPDSDPPAWGGIISHTRTENEFPDWLGWTFNALSSTRVSGSNGGRLNCYAMQLTGPAAFWPLVEKIEWAGDERRVVQGPGGARYLSAHGDDNRVGTFQAMPATPAEAPAPPDDESGAWNFIKGFGSGFWDGGVDLVESGWTSATKLLKAGLRYSPFGIAYTMTWGDKFETEKRFFSATTDVVKILADMWLNLQADKVNYVVALLEGDVDTAQAISKPYLDAFKGCAELLAEIPESVVETIANATAKQIGYFCGRATFEILSLLVAELKVVQIGKVALLAKVRQLPFFATEIGVKAFQRIETLITALLFKPICFVAGTKVQTADGLRAIETIQPGDRVLSRDPASRRQEFRRVSAVHTTRPGTIYTIVIRDSVRQLEHSIESTGQHPFYSLTAEDFVPASELKAGDQLPTKDGEAVMVASVRAAEVAVPITAYNLEIEEFGTYFVGEFSVWVHNAAAVTCPEVHAFYLAMRKAHPTETAWEVVFRMKSRLKHVAYKGNVWRLALKDANDEVFTKIANGQLPLSAAKSYKEINDKFAGYFSWGHWDTDRINNHHIVEKFIQRKFGIPESQINNVPGFIMNGESHAGTGTPSGAKNLASKLRKEILHMSPDPANWPNITAKIREVYLAHDEPGMDILWAVTRKWLDSKGIPTPLDPP